LIWKKTLLVSAAIAALALPAGAQAFGGQTFGLGGSVGLVDNVGNGVTDGFKHSEVTGWLDYQFEKAALLRLTFGSMRTQQTNAGQTVSAPGGGLITVPDQFKERINYATVGVSYLWFEGFFTSGLIGGIGAYHFIPDTLPPEYAAYADQNGTFFGFHLGTEAIFRVFKNTFIVGRLTYHQILAQPKTRQFLNADVGAEFRF
jgi:hypothetical protein